MGKYLNSIEYDPGRAIQYIIATSDATTIQKAEADLVLTGTSGSYANESAFQTLIDAAPDGANIKIVGQNCYLSKGLSINIDRCVFDYEGVKINYNSAGEDTPGTGYALTFGSTAMLDVIKVRHGWVEATGDAATSTNAGGIDFQYIFASDLGSPCVSLFAAGTAVRISTDVASSHSFSMNQFGTIHSHNCKTVLKMTGDNGIGSVRIAGIEDHVDNTAMDGNAVIDSTGLTGYAVDLHIWAIRTEPHTENDYWCIKDNYYIYHSTIDNIYIDSSSASFGSQFVLNTGLMPSFKIGNIKVLNLKAGGKVPLMGDSYNSNYVKTIKYGSGDMVNLSAGGSSAAIGARRIDTEAGASQSGGSFVVAYNWFDAGVNTRINFGKRIRLSFDISPEWSDAQAVFYFQLKQTAAEGALGAMGLGIKAANLALYGDTYGTSLDNPNLSTNLSQYYSSHIDIDFIPGWGVEWFVNGYSKASDVTSGKYPTGTPATAYYLVFTIKNGVAATQDYGFISNVAVKVEQ